MPAKPRRPSHPYSDALAADFLCRLSAGRALKSVCSDPDMPTAVAVYGWINTRPDFAARVAASRDLGGPGKGNRSARNHPCRYSPGLADAICAALAEGATLAQVCASPDVPVVPHTVRRWARRRAAFAGQLRAAQETGSANRAGPGRPGGCRVGRGAPSAYTPKLADYIIEQLWEGRALEAIQNDPGVPPAATVRHWRKRYLDFDQAYRRARDAQVQFLMDDMFEAARDGPHVPPKRMVLFAALRRDGYW